MANQQLRFELLGDASGLTASFSEATDAAELTEGQIQELQRAADIAAQSQADLSDAAERAGGSLVELGDVVEQATRGQIRYNEATERFQDTSGEFVAGAEAQEQALVGVIQENQRLQQELRQTEERSEQMGRGFDTVQGPGAELGFLLQDLSSAGNSLQGAIRGAANNIPQLLLEFQQMRATGTSLTSMFTGTGGLLIAVNAVAGALPLLVNQLSETEDKMGDVSDAAEDAVSDIQQLASQALTIEGEGEFDFQIPADRLQEANQIIETRVQALQSIQEAIPDVGGIIPARQFEQLGPVAQQIVQDIQAQTDSLLIQEDAVQGRLEAAKGLSQELDTQVEKQRQRRQLLEELGIIADDNSETVGKTAENLQEARQEAETLRARYEALLGPQGTALAQARRTKEQLEGQVEALQNVNRIIARREQGIQAEQVQPAPPDAPIGPAPPVLQTIQDLSGQSNVLKQYAQRLREAKIQAQELAEALEDIELAGSGLELGRGSDQNQGTTVGGPGLSALGMSVEEIQRQFDVGKRKALQFKDAARQQLGQVLSMGARLGTTLKQAFEQGEAGARDFAKAALPLVGQIIGTIAGGPGGGAIGGAIGQFAALPFAEGGEVRGPGGPTDDQVPAMLSDQEFVMRAASAQVAPEALQAMNQNPALAGMIEQLVTAKDVEQLAGSGMVGAGSTSNVTAEAVFEGLPPEEFSSGGAALDTHTASHDASVEIRAQSTDQQVQALNRIAERLDEMEVRGTLTSNMDRLRADIDRNAEFKGR